MYILNIILLVCVQCIYVLCASVPPENEYKLNIIHYNDFHARYEETSVQDAICRSDNASCLGGFPRLYGHIRTLLAAKPDAVLLNAGDTFQGTYWHTLLKWGIAQQFMNLLPHDAHAIGNHDFDDGPSGLAPYLQALKAPVLAANMDTSEEPILQGTYRPSTIIERLGRKIGIIGLITTETPILSSPGNVKITNPGKALKREAEALTKQGVDIIILLSHCGFPIDKELSRDYGEHIDVIIGGHSHSLLWNGPAPSGEFVTDTYPVFVESARNISHKVLIVQASAFTKYMGDLTVYFDEQGKYVKWEGGPIFLNRSIPEDPEIKKMLEPYAKSVHEAENIPVGSTLTALDSVECGSGECTLGNLLTDAMVEYVKEKMNAAYHYLAFVQRGNILLKKFDKGTITQVNMFNMYPYLDRILYFKLKGKYVRQVLEEAVVDATSIEPFDGPWVQQLSGFRIDLRLNVIHIEEIQFFNRFFVIVPKPGLRVIYNVSLPEGNRVSTVYIGGSNSLQLMDDNEYYHILTAKFATYFGKGFKEVMNFTSNMRELGRDHTTLEAYVRQHSPLNVITSGRIVIYK